MNAWDLAGLLVVACILAALLQRHMSRPVSGIYTRRDLELRDHTYSDTNHASEPPTQNARQAELEAPFADWAERYLQ